MRDVDARVHIFATTRLGTDRVASRSHFFKIRGATAPKSQDRLKCCQMAVQGTLWLAKCLFLNLNFSFLNRISLLLNQIATQLSSRGWVDPGPDPILPEKFLGYSRESNPGPPGWQSDMLTTIHRWSSRSHTPRKMSRL